MDINLFRTKKELVKESQAKRFKAVGDVDEVCELDEKWRAVYHELGVARKELGDIQDSLNPKKAPAGQTETQLADNKAKQVILKETVARLEKAEAELLKNRDEKLYAIGNLVHASVPVSTDEANNAVVKVWGTNRPQTPDLLHHHVLLYRIGGYEPDAGSEVAGHRGYYLTGMGYLLNNALIQYGLQFLAERNYQPVQPPYFMKQTAMKKVAALAEFDEALYKVTGNIDDEPMYLIATSEQPLCALHMGQSLVDKDLPIKYTGFSTCFRKEAGSYGKDAWGTFRVHQFEKIEQFVLCHPEKSWEMQEAMIRIAEEFYESLELPYHVVTIVSGELNNAAAKKYDLEAWFPTLACYRELVSCSNCTDYQARRLGVRYGTQKAADGTIPYVHMLNSTLCATERALCCVLENYQTPEGIRVPKVLKPFLDPFMKNCKDPDVMPFIRAAQPPGKGAKGAAKKA